MSEKETKSEAVARDEVDKVESSPPRLQQLVLLSLLFRLRHQVQRRRAYPSEDREKRGKDHREPNRGRRKVALRKMEAAAAALYESERTLLLTRSRAWLLLPPGFRADGRAQCDVHPNAVREERKQKPVSERAARLRSVGCDRPAIAERKRRRPESNSRSSVALSLSLAETRRRWGDESSTEGEKERERS